MAREFIVTIEDKPGELARLGEQLGKSSVNVEAIMATTVDQKGLVRFVPSNAEKARAALDTGGYLYNEREVLIVNVLDEPGALGDAALVMSHAGINIDTVYGRTDGNVIFGVDDLDGAIQVAQGMAIL